MFEKTAFLVLYDVNKPNRLSVYSIIGHQEMSGTELASLDYPHNLIGKRYMLFNIVGSTLDPEVLKANHIIESLTENYPNHVKGAPVFLEP